MKFLCLTPLYNHGQWLTENVYQSLIDQTHSNWIWVLGDDRPEPFQLSGLVDPDPRVVLKKFSTRCSSMGEKYAGMVAEAEARGIEWDAIAIMDGDDFFTPKHLEHHARMLLQDDFSYPSIVITTYAGIIQVEATAGRFWSSVAFTKNALSKINGFGDSKIVGFDQEMLGKLKDACGVVDSQIPTYVYRWGDTGSDHTSGHSSGFSCTEWWGKTPVYPAGGLLYPKLDDYTENEIVPGTKRIYQERGIEYQ